jgi:hypothetical protein
MKKYFSRVALAVLLVVGFSAASSAQVIVRVRPTPPVVVRTAPPSPRHVWIDGGWVERGGRYVWVDGYWAVPRRGYHWAPGYWARRRGGYVYIRGHWVR